MAQELAPEYGTDISCLTDIEPTLRLATGTELMAQVCFRCIYCRQGSLLSDPTRATLDVRDLLSQGMQFKGLATINALCEAAILTDPRVDTVSISSTYDQREKALTMSITGTGALGPFELTLSITEVTVEILRAA